MAGNDKDRISWTSPHRIIFLGLVALFLFYAITKMRWDWLPEYWPLALQGIWRTIWVLVLSVGFGFVLAIPIGLVQVTGPRWLSWPAKIFCNVIRGTPLLLQLWLLYNGLGSLFPQFPWIRDSWAWPILRQAWPYGLLALTLSFAAYEAEIMRGAFAGTPRGQLEAGRAYGMSPSKLFWRIWLPQAVQRALPTLGGETVLQLKATPLVATITMIDIYAVSSKVRQDTLLVYEPLLLLALVYLILTAIIVYLFKNLEQRIPTRSA
jgi:polar amino acid transport system permease protein